MGCGWGFLGRLSMKGSAVSQASGGNGFLVTATSITSRHSIMSPGFPMVQG